MIRLNNSIFRRLLLCYILTIILGLGTIGILISFLVRGSIYDAKQEELLRKAKKVNLAIQEVSTVDENAEHLLLFLDEAFDARIWVFDRQGNVIMTTTNDEVSIGKSVAKDVVTTVLKGEDAVTEFKVPGFSEPMLSVVVPWGKDNRLYGGIVLYSEVDGATETIGKIRETILWVTVFGMMLSIMIASYLSWSISRPLKKINQAASQIGMGNYHQRIDTNSAEEIDDLATTINTIAEKLEKTDQERRALDQLRNDFLANASHELRTPLTAMQGFLEALQDGLIPEEARHKYYGVMYQETMHMNRLVNDLLDLAKLENKDVVLSKHPVDVELLLQKVAFKFSQEAAEKGLELKVVCRKPLSKAFADQDRLEQILANLVNNAVKFTEQGYVHLHGAEDAKHILLTVTDSGVGISETDQELIWERFFKADRGRSKKNNGTGLGMAIVKKLVELHEGKITVSSRLGLGTSFTVSIPKFREPVPARYIARVGSNINLSSEGKKGS